MHAYLVASFELPNTATCRRTYPSNTLLLYFLLDSWAVAIQCRADGNASILSSLQTSDDNHINKRRRRRESRQPTPGQRPDPYEKTQRRGPWKACQYGNRSVSICLVKFGCLRVLARHHLDVHCIHFCAYLTHLTKTRHMVQHALMS